MDQFEDFATFIALLGVMVELSFVNFGMFCQVLTIKL